MSLRALVSAPRGWLAHPLAAPALIALAAAGLRLWGLTAQPIWFDESVLVAYGRLEPALWLAKLSEAREGVFLTKAPLLVLLLHGWIYGVGTGAAILRLPFVVVGVATVLVLYWIVQRLYGRTVAVFAALLLALSPYHIYYSQQVTEYGPLVLAGLGSHLLWVRLSAAERPGLWGQLALPALNLLGLALHPGHAFVTGTQLVLQLGWRRARPLPLLVGQLLSLGAAAAVGVWLATRGGFVATALGWIPPLTPELALEALRQFSHGVMSHGELHDGAAGGLLDALLVLMAALILGGAVLLGRGADGARRRGARPLLLLWVGAPVLFAVAVSFTFHSVAIARYYIIVLPGLLVLASLSLGFVWQRSRPVALTLLLALLALLGHAYVRQQRLAGPSIREMVADFKQRWRAGDGVLLTPDHLRYPFGYYFDRKVARWIARQTGPDGLWMAVSGSRDPGRQGRAEIRHWLRRRPRVWLALIRDWPGDHATPRIERHMERNFRRRWHRRYPFSGAELILYVPRTRAPPAEQR